MTEGNGVPSSDVGEPNYNHIELGPRGAGKSYFFSEFSPYATLISGGQATKSTLFYNNARRKVGLVGYWDTVPSTKWAESRTRSLRKCLETKVNIFRAE